MAESLEETIKKQRERYVELFTLSSDKQTEMFQTALDGKYTPKKYVKDMSRCWADGVSGFAGLATGWIAVAQAVANAKPAADSDNGNG